MEDLTNTSKNQQNILENMANWKLFKIKEVSDGEDFHHNYYNVRLDGKIPFSGSQDEPSTYTNDIKIKKKSVPDKKYISAGSSIEINMSKNSDRINLWNVPTNLFDFGFEVRRPEVETLKEDLETANEKIKELNSLVENLEKVPAEQEAAQISWYKKQFPQEFAELEKNITGRDIYMSDFINLLVGKRKASGKKIRLIKKSLNNLQQSNNKFNQLLNQERYQNRQINVELQQEKTNYRDTAIDLVKEKSQARKATTALKKRALELKNDLVNEEDKVKNLQNKIDVTEQDLGVSLDNLATELEGKTIAEYKLANTRERERERERERDLRASWFMPKLKPEIIRNN